MEGPLERYQKMEWRASFSLAYRYPIACEELSFIIRFSYSDLPKPLQSLVFRDALSAFRLLPDDGAGLNPVNIGQLIREWSRMQMQSAVSAANNLIQSVEAALPKQKKVMAVKEFKQAMVSHKRRNKCQQEDKDLIELPQDILLHLFSFLDMQSLISAGMVCRSWNAAANDNFLWKAHYSTYFEDLHIASRDKFHVSRMRLKDIEHSASSNAADGTLCSYKDSFRRRYKASPSLRFKHNRGYCGRCNTIVWLTFLNCPNTHVESRYGYHLIRPILSPNQIVYFILNGSPPATFSDSDSDSDEEIGFKLWAYQRN